MLRAALRAPRAAQMMAAPRVAPATRRMGGGGAHPPSPTHVWSPAGGWFADPPHDPGVPRRLHAVDARRLEE